MDIILENKHFRLVLGEDARAKSLFCKDTEQECLAGETIPLCAVTQPRFFNNENKLAHPVRPVTLQANSLHREGDALVVGFTHATYKTLLEVKETDAYISFRVAGFRVPEETVASSDMVLNMDMPPADTFRFLQLPVKNREKFGEWLGVMWDDNVAVSILAATPEVFVDNDEGKTFRVMTAEAGRHTRLTGAEAALVVTETAEFLDAVETFEKDHGLPEGVRSRRDPALRRSYYAAVNVFPDTVDIHLDICKKGGFRHMLLTHNNFFDYKGYNGCGDYDDGNIHPRFPKGREDLAAMLQKIRSAGITPGLHFLHTHIGLKSRYVTPRADPRLGIKTHFTLAKPLGKDDTALPVLQDTRCAPMADGTRILKFGSELISYEGCCPENRCFTGCVRGYLDTEIAEHPAGETGGVLDVSEYGAASCYLDQSTDLQEEIAEKLARLYDLGFEFVYFDGSEGTGEPYAYHVSNAQWRVWKKLKTPPLFSEGAARSHFSWHMLSGGNAFDAFGPDAFKSMIRKHPAAEAPQMQMDFTRLNFGWWRVFPDLQPDHWEYGCAVATAWDCPVSVGGGLTRWQKHPHPEDLLEVLRRWEDVRIHDLLTPEEKKTIRENPLQEHILLLNEEKQYELVPYEQIAAKDETIRAFLFTRRGKNWVVYWHVKGEGELSLIPDAEVCEELYESPVIYASGVVPASHRRYWKTDLSRQEIMNLLGE